MPKITLFLRLLYTRRLAVEAAGAYEGLASSWATYAGWHIYTDAHGILLSGAAS